jgi:hypothetical protein
LGVTAVVLTELLLDANFINFPAEGFFGLVFRFEVPLQFI